MRSFRTSFFRLVCLACLVFSAKASYAQLDLGAVLEGLGDPDNWFYTRLTARQSTVSGGDGQVSLTIADMNGNIFTEFMGNDITPLINSVNPDGNPSPYSASVSMISAAPIYMPGVESDLMGVPMSSYAYFLGNAQPADGSWFAGWSYTNGGTDMGKEDNTLFKLLPSNLSGYSHVTSSTVYATFKPVLVTNYAGGKGEVTAVAGSTGDIVVTIDVDGGDKALSVADFNMPTLPAGWAISSWDYNTTTAGKVTLNITYTAQASVEAGVEYKTTMAFSSKGGSSLNVPLVVRAVAADRTEATVKIADAEYNESWAAALARANANAGAVLMLNQDVAVASTQTITNAITLNLNGYTLSSTSATPLRVDASGKSVTMAYSKFGGAIEAASSMAIDLKAGTLTMDGGSVSGSVAVNVQSGATLNVNGATLTGSVCGVQNNGTTTVADGNISGTTYAVDSKAGSLTLRGGSLSGATAVYVEAGSANIVRATISGGAYGVLSKATTTIEKLAMIDATGVALSVAGGSTTVNCGKFAAPTPISKTAGTLNLISGYFKTESIGVALPAGKKLWNVTTGVEYTQGYTYYLGESSSCVCKIGSTAYATLEEALAYANNNPSKQVTILMQNDYTLPSGYYTLPANATLIIPMSLEQETDYPIINRYSNNSVTEVLYVQPTEFMRLTFAAGVNMDVRGTIEVTGSQLASDESYAAVPFGPYGHLVMAEGSHMTLGDGALLRVWGFMTGKGETDARRGAIVREQFQMGDWKGGTTSMNMLSDGRRVFPLTTYFIQSVESPVKYHPGAILSTTTSVSAAAGGLALTAMANDIKIVGVNGRDEAMFLMDDMADAENTWVRKWYDVEHDIQTYEVNSGAHIGSMVLDLGKIGTQPLVMNSGWFNLPITSNMKIHLLSGSMDFTQNTALLPGAEVEIDKESTISVTYDPDNSEVITGSLYVYDADEWRQYVYDDGRGNKYAKAVRYSPSWNGMPTARDLEHVKDATINVHGTFDSQLGWILGSAGGANIFSTNEDAGTFRFGEDAPWAGYQEEVYQVRGRSEYMSSMFSACKLRNEDGTFAETAGTQAGKSYCYMNGRWTMMDIDEDDECFFVDNYGQFYIKPAEFVAINATKTDGVISGNADHTYSDAAGTGRLFILLPENCQWWEVENVDNLYHCVHPGNDTYYYWDEDEEMWMEKRFTITWANWDGTPLELSDGSDEYRVTYGTMAEYLGTNPTREPNVDYTYDFTGWSPALAPVTSDVTYTATYQPVQRKYTIIFQQEGGMEIERHFLTRDEMPVCEDEPTKVGHILQWEPAIAAVTGDQVYTATWLEEKPAFWTIDWYNYDGTKLEQTEVAADAEASVVEASFTKMSNLIKPATTEFTYEFDHWAPAIVPATANAAYTAVYREVGKTYMVSFEDELGNVIENNTYLYGATPVCSQAPAKANTAEFSYTFAWEPQIQTVTKDAIYRATFTPVRNQYKVTVLSNNAAFGSVSGAGVYDYGTMVTVSAVPASVDYEFVEWQEDHSASATHAAFALTGNVTYTAVFREKAVTYDITFLNEDGSLIETNAYDYGVMPVCSQMPTKANTAEFTYAFSWIPAIAPVSGPATYQATFTPTRNQYTVTLRSTNDDVCNLTGAGMFDYGTMVMVSAVLTSDDYEFVEWQEDHSTSATHAAFVLTEDVTFTAVIREKVPDNLTIGLGAVTTISSPAEVHNLTILSDGSVSGQLKGADLLTVTGDADFCLTLDAAAHTWYTVAVPWQVDAASGISIGGGRQLVLGSDLDVVCYNGASRAANGSEGDNWIFLEDEGDQTLYPGRLYMIYLAEDQTTLLFRKKADAPLFTPSLSVAAYDAAEPQDANWNGIANPATFYAYLNAGTEYAQTYDPVSQSYSALDMSATALVVGQPVFVQAPAAKTVMADASSYAAVAARRAEARQADIRCEVTLSQGEHCFDRIFLHTAEEKAAEYVIGQDVAKVGISSKVPQMWIDRYDAQLCVNTTALVLGSADYPMGIAVPADGQYSINLAEAANLGNKALYLTIDGIAVWNLADGAYVANLEAGTTARYGLRIAEAEAPGITTSLESVADGAEQVRKVLVDDVVYIIRGNDVYTITGQKTALLK